MASMSNRCAKPFARYKTTGKKVERVLKRSPGGRLRVLKAEKWQRQIGDEKLAAHHEGPEGWV